MLRLDTINRTLQIQLAGAVTTNQLPVVVCFSTKAAATYDGATQLSTTNDTTLVTICSAPGASEQRDVDYLSIWNRDTVDATIILILDDNATPYQILRVTLEPNEQLIYTHGDGWRSIDPFGNMKSVSAGGGGSTALDDLSDVTITAPATGATLIYNGSQWVDGQLDLADPDAVTGILPIARGGTNLGTTPTNGQLLIGNGTDYTLNTLTAGTNVSIVNGVGTITINATASAGSLPWCRVATTGNLNLAAPGGTIDGVTMIADDRVLVWQQTTASENGVYVWNGAATPMTRATDFDDWSEVPGRAFVVTEGTLYDGAAFTCYAEYTGTIDVTAIPITGLVRRIGPGARIDLGNSWTLARATNSNGPRGFSLIDDNAVMRVWRYTATPGSAPAIEFVWGTTADTPGDAANEWWDFALDNAAGNGMRIARRETGVTDLKMYISETGTRVGTDIAGTNTVVGFEIATTDAMLMPVGTTGQRPTGVEGYVRYNSTIVDLEGFINGGWLSLSSPPASDTVAGKIEIATQAEIEAAASTTLAVTPGRQHFHPSAAKFWVKAGTTGNNLASYNVTSLTDTGTGVLTVTIATDFSSTNWVCLVSISNLDATIDSIADGQMPMIANASQAAGSVQLLCKNDDGTAAADPQFWFVAGFGDQ